MVSVVEHWPSKLEFLSSIHNTTKKRECLVESYEILEVVIFTLLGMEHLCCQRL
jgi:hypothetical protein